MLIWRRRSLTERINELYSILWQDLL